jgi:hypothetical protein
MDLTDYAWAMQLPPGTAFRRPDGVTVHLASAPSTAPLCPSPDHVWVEEIETDKGGWVKAGDVRGWERV